MGLPEVIIDFTKKASTALTRSERGIVAIVLKDSTVGKSESSVYSYITQVKEADYEAANYDLIQKCFLGSPNKVIVERIAIDTLDYTEVLTRLRSKKFNYLAIPQIEDEQKSTIITWIKSCRANKKTFKAVLPNVDTVNYEGIIDFSTDEIETSEKIYSTAEYCVRIAGILAGLSLNKSCTYYVLDEVTSIKESENPDDDINAGKLILINDGEKIKIARGVNSLTTISDAQVESFKKIKIIEGIDLIKDDIRSTFEDNYVGDVANGYSNKAIFIAANNIYFKNLEKQGVLDPDYENLVEIDTEEHKEFIMDKGIDIDTLSDEEIKKYNTGTKVFIKANVQFLDAMEDLYFSIGMEE